MPDLNLAVVIAGKDAASQVIKAVKGEIGGLGDAAAAASKAIAGVGLAAGAAAAGGLAVVVKSAASFEKTMSGVKAVSDATQEEMRDLSQLALQLGRDTAFSASEAASALEELVKGGLTVPDIMHGAAEATLNLAAAGGVSLPEAATIAANALAQFNLKGQDMAHVADLIAGAANASAIDVGQFKLSLQQSGAVAATVGFSFDDLAQAIAIMGKAGIAGSDAGTSLKTMMLNLQPTTDKQIALFKELGLLTASGANAFFDATGKVRSMAEVAGTLQTALKGMTEQQKLATLEVIFGSDAIRAGAVLAKEGATGFATMAEAMGKVTAASVGAERLNNLNGSLEQLKGSVETAAITLGLKLTPALTLLVNKATAAVNAALPLIEAWGQKLADAMQAVIDVAPDLGRAIDQAVHFFVTGGGDIETFRGVLNRLIGPQGTQVVIEAFTNLTGTIQQQVMPAIRAMIDAWPTVQRAMTDAEPTVMEIAKAFGETLADSLRVPVRLIHEEVIPAFNEIKAWWDSPSGSATGDAIKAYFDEHLPAALAFAKQSFELTLFGPSGTFQRTKDAWNGPNGKAIWDQVSAVFTDTLPAALRSFGAALEEMLRAVRNAGPAAQQAAREIGEGIVRGIAQGIGDLRGWLEQQAANLAADVIAAGKRALRISSPSLAAAEEIGVPFVEGIGHGIDLATPGLLDKIDQLTATLVDQALAGAAAVADAWADFGGMAGGGHGNMLGGGGGGLPGDLADFFSQVGASSAADLYYGPGGKATGAGTASGFFGGYAYDPDLDTNLRYAGMSATPGKITSRLSGINMALYRARLLATQHPDWDSARLWEEAVAFVLRHAVDPGATGFTAIGAGHMLAAGGAAAAGETYLVGERGPELLTMGGRGGYVSPGAGWAIDYDRLAAAMVRALAGAPLVVSVDDMHGAFLRKQRRTGALGLT